MNNYIIKLILIILGVCVVYFNFNGTIYKVKMKNILTQCAKEHNVYECELKAMPKEVK